MRPLVALVHMPKAGGTTLTEILRSVYGQKLLVSHPLRGWPQEWPPEFLSDVAAKRTYYDAFSGHAAYGIHEIFGRPAVYLSSVRDPVERFESYYNFVQHWKIHHHHQAAQGKSIGEFFRFLRDRNDIELFNLQCLMLCGQKTFQAVRDWVTSRYLAVAPISLFDQSVTYIAAQLQWGKVQVPKLNVTEHRSKTDQLSDSDLKALTEGNSADRDLVKFCEDTMAAKIAQSKAA